MCIPQTLLNKETEFKYFSNISFLDKLCSIRKAIKASETFVERVRGLGFNTRINCCVIVEAPDMIRLFTRFCQDALIIDAGETPECSKKPLSSANKTASTNSAE